MDSPDPHATATLADALAGIVPASKLLIPPGDGAFYASDVYSSGEPALLVAIPETVDQRSRIVATCTELEHTVIARGARLSYTAGFLPANARSVIIDTSRLDRIVEINREDMYVTAEAGCTWRQLYEALKGERLRTPYFGPMSGFSSTVEGA